MACAGHEPFVKDCDSSVADVEACGNHFVDCFANCVARFDCTGWSVIKSTVYKQGPEVSCVYRDLILLVWSVGHIYVVEGSVPKNEVVCTLCDSDSYLDTWANSRVVVWVELPALHLDCGFSRVRLKEYVRGNRSTDTGLHSVYFTLQVLPTNYA